MASITQTGGNVNRKATRITFIAEETLPPLGLGKFCPSASLRHGCLVGSMRNSTAKEEYGKHAVIRRNAPSFLDGFLLLEACGVEFPDEASRAELQEMGLTGQQLKI